MVGHGGMVRALDISPDGRRVLSGSFDFTARLWDFAEQTEIAVLDAHSGPVTSVAFVGDASRALTASDDKTIILWDLKALKPLKPLKPLKVLQGHEHKVMGLAVSGDGRFAASGSWDKTVRVWDLSLGRTVRILRHTSPVNAVVFADAGQTVVAGGHDGKIQVWNAKTGLSRGILEGHFMGITGLRVTTDGRWLLSASIDKSLRRWDLVAMKKVREFKKHEGQVFAAVFSPDVKTVVSAGRDGVVIQWDLSNGKPVRSIKAHDAIIWALGLSPDGRFVLTGGADDSIRVWHLESGDRIGLPAEGDTEPKPWLDSDHPGASLFKKCARCHSLNANGIRRSGPHLAGLFGRAAGSVAGYNYSRALTGADFQWNARTLFQLFDQGPDKYLPGTKMPIQKIPNAEQLTHLVDYLQEITETN
jgi:cytochrome c